MCVIMHFTPGSMIPKEAFFNAVYNNWNGYGIILKDANGQLQVIRDCPKDGNDPEVLWKIVEDNKDIDRFVHVRHATKGSVDLDNTQPFPVYSSDKRQVYFMHNGTFHNFGATNTYGRTPQTGDKSDTIDFCEKILQPVLLRWVGENGKADYLDETFSKMILDKNWTHSSKGLFISNDLQSMYYGNGWEEFEKGGAPVVYVSNKDYFRNVTRGPFFEAQKLERERTLREAALKARSEAGQDGTENPVNGTNGGPLVSDIIENNVVSFNPDRLSKSMVLIRALGGIFLDNDIDTLAGQAKLAAIDIPEWEEVVREENSFFTATILSKLADKLHEANAEIESMSLDLDRAKSNAQRVNIELKELQMKEKRVG